MFRVCKHCGADFVARVTDVNRGQGVYCSLRCSGLSHKGLCITPPSTKPERLRANALINARVKRGRMDRPEKCGQCGKTGRVDAHHEDYTQPDKVEWLCRSCHMKRHHSAEVR